MERVDWNQAVRPSTHDLIAAINSGADDIERIDSVLDGINDDITALETGKADVSGTYPDFVAGEALSLRSGIRSNTFLTRALDTDVADGIAEVQAIKGNTVVWNQLGYQGDFPSADSIWQASTSGVSISRPGGEITATSSANNVPPGIKTYSSPIADKLISGHKYYVSIEAKGSRTVAMSLYSESVTTNQVFPQTNLSETFTKLAGIVNFVRQESFNGVRISGRGSDAIAGDWVTIRNFMLIDLTAMFGAGNEPQTVAEFEAQYPADYYAYSAPALLSSHIAGIEGAGSCEFPAQTLRGIGTAQDVMTKAGIERVIGEIDLGGFTWTKSGSQFYTALSQAPTSSNVDAKCAKYERKVITGWQDLTEGTFAIRSGTLRIHDSSYEDAAAFKAGNTGVKLQFVLATPTTETFTAPIDLTYSVEAGGTEAWIVPSGTAPTSAAVTGEIAYPVNPARAYISHDSFADFIDKLGAFISATITETWDGSKYTYSFASGRSLQLGNIEERELLGEIEIVEKDDIVKEIIEDEERKA